MIYTLMVDIDTRKHPVVNHQGLLMWVVNLLFPWVITWNIEIAVSPSGRGWHLVCAFDSCRKISPYMLLLAQCLAGSDIARERNNLRRIVSGEKDWNILFATKRETIWKNKDKKKVPLQQDSKQHCSFRLNRGRKRGKRG